MKAFTLALTALCFVVAATPGEILVPISVLFGLIGLGVLLGMLAFDVCEYVANRIDPENR